MGLLPGPQIWTRRIDNSMLDGSGGGGGEEGDDGSDADLIEDT